VAASGNLLVTVSANIGPAAASLGQLQNQVNVLGKGAPGGVAGGQINAVGAAAQNATGPVNNLGASFRATQRAGLLLAGIGVAIELGFAGAIKTASDYQTAIAKIEALTGTSAQIVQGYSDQILKLSQTVAKSPKDLADALYFIVSAGFSGAQAMNILTISSKGAVGGLGETKVVADAVTSSLNAYHLAADQASHITDVFTNAVVQGKMEPAALAANLGKVLPIAAATGVSLEEVTANIATMSRIGASVPQSVTALIGVLNAMDKPSKQMIGGLKEIGLTVADLRAELKDKGLAGLLQDVIGRAGNNIDVLAPIFGNIRGLKDVLATAGTQGEAYNSILESMGGVAGRTDSAFRTMTATIAAQSQLLSNAAQVVGIDFTKLVGGPLIAVMQFGRQVLEAFHALPAPIQGAIFAFVGIAGAAALVGGALVFLAPALAALPTAFMMISAVVGTAVIPALVAAAPVILGVVAALAGVALVVTHWDQVRTVVAGALNAVADAAGVVVPALALLLAPFIVVGLAVYALAKAFIDNWAAIRDTVTSTVSAIIGDIGRLLQGMASLAGPLDYLTGGAFGSKSSPFADSINQGIDSVNASLGNIPSSVADSLRGVANVVNASDPFAGLRQQANDIMGSVIDAFNGKGSNVPASPGAAVEQADPNAIVNDQNAQLDALKNQLTDARDNLGNLRDTAGDATAAAHDTANAARLAGEQARQAGAAGAAGFRPFAQQIDAVDKAISRIQLGQLEKAYARIIKRPINPNRPTSMLPRLELEKQILEHEQTIATPFGFGSAAARAANRVPRVPTLPIPSAGRNPAVLAEEDRIRALTTQIHQYERQIELTKAIAVIVGNIYGKPGAFADLNQLRAINPFRDVPIQRAADSGRPEGSGAGGGGAPPAGGITGDNLDRLINPYRDFTRQVKASLDPIPLNTQVMLDALTKTVAQSHPYDSLIAKGRDAVSQLEDMFGPLLRAPLPPAFAQSGSHEGGGGFQYPSPGASSTTTNTNNQNFNAPIISTGPVNSQVDMDAAAQKAIDIILKSGPSTTNSAPSQLPGNSNPGY